MLVGICSYERERGQWHFSTLINSSFLYRAKYHKLKYGTELNQGDMKPPNYDSGKN